MRSGKRRVVSTVALTAMSAGGCASSDTDPQDGRSDESAQPGPSAPTDPTDTRSSATDTAVDPDVTVVLTMATAPSTSTLAPSETVLTSGRAQCEPALADARVVRTGSHWTPGEARDLEVEIRRSAVGGDAASVTPVTLTVLDQVAPAGARLEWMSSQKMMQGLPVPAEVAEMMNEVPRERIVYTVSAAGAMGPVENVDELRAAAQQIAELLDEVGFADPQGGAQLGDLYDGLSDEAFARMFSERPAIFHALDGIELADGQPLSGGDLLPNGLGGEPFPATTTVMVTDLIDDDGCVEITMTVLPDPDEFARILGASLEAAGWVDDADELSSVVSEAVIKNTVVAQYDHATGRAISVHASQLMEIAGERRLDETIIRDITTD